MFKPWWELALELEHYIRDFIPGGWKEPIHKVMFVPFVSESDVKAIANGTIPDKFTKQPAFLWAIRTWLTDTNVCVPVKED